MFLVAVDRTEMNVVVFLLEQKEGEEETTQCYCTAMLLLSVKAECAVMNLS